MGCGNIKESKITSPKPAVTAPDTTKAASPRSDAESVTRSVAETVRAPASSRFTDPNIMLRQYQLGEVLGSGAFATVKKVKHKATEQIRALKVIHKSGLTPQHLSEDQMLQELRILSALAHPNILHLYEWYEDSLRYYLITEYCAGGELYTRLSEVQQFTEAEVAKIMYQVLSAVVYSHSQGVTHRDLKPENMFLIGAELELKVADFGSSAFLDPDRKMQGVFGSGYYIAPEVIEGEYDEKCDVWSCGIILYVLLTGCPPYPGRSEPEILENIRQGKMNLKRMEGLSSDCIQLILRMLERDPKKRVSALDAMSHKWVQRFREKSLIKPRDLSGALENLRNFNKACKLKDAILSFIANQIISEAEKRELASAFQELDRNGDGRISTTELKAKFAETMGEQAATEQVFAIMAKCDRDRSGFIDYEEFLKANVETARSTSKQNLEAAFRVFDRDASGTISAEELRWVMVGSRMQDEAWEELLREVDSNHDGEIDLREFLSLVQTKF